MINLHERLSEFSYGYGVTREAERELASVGVRTTPFLPSLIHENQLGFDVAFDRPGAALLLQFKLGQEMKRYRSVPPGQPAPPGLSSKFWRFHLDTSEAQFRLLLDAEQRRKTEVYYVAPRFSTWQAYDVAYQTGKVLDNSLLVTPLDIHQALVAQGAAPGRHRVVYDKTARYLCSEPIEIPETKRGEMAKRVLQDLRVKPQNLGDLVHLWADRSQAVGGSRATSDQRLQRLRARARSPEDAAAASFALDAWSVGAQAIFVTDPPPSSVAPT